jgi:hypothetical protein
MNPQPNDETPASINLKHLLDSIEHALRLEHFLPAIILIYAGIDAAAWLASDTNEEVGKQFRRWVDHWMLPAKLLLATALELYAARCAFLHTFTADSGLSKTGKARRIAYATREASAKWLQARLDAMGRSDIVVVHIADLYDAFRLGFAAYLDSLHSDPVACARTMAKMDRYTFHLHGEALKNFLQ